MFDIAPSELLVLGTVALLVIPPKDLPRAMRVAGYWVGRARSAARQFRSGFDTIVRDAEMQEMEKKWREENDRIMREHPATPDQIAMMPLPAPADPHADEGAAPPVLVAPPEIAPEVPPGPASVPVEHAAEGRTAP
jgi:sec-independent protein translocase protein TatB